MGETGWQKRRISDVLEEIRKYLGLEGCSSVQFQPAPFHADLAGHQKLVWAWSLGQWVDAQGGEVGLGTGSCSDVKGDSEQ